MPIYSCEYCNFDTKNKYDYSRHLKTQKHKYRTQHFEDLGDGNVIYQKNALKEQKRPKMTQNDPKMTQNDPKMNQKKHYCRYCNREFSTKAHMRRHEIHRCKSDRSINYELKIERMRKQFEREKNKLYKQIDKLIDKAGDTTINNTNNIQLNNFGEEDTSYITDKILEKLITYPATMISNLLELTHFHKDHPENKNLKITNKKDKYIKVYKDHKWKLDKKDIVIDNIVNNKFDTLETFYIEKGKNSIKSYQKKRFEKYQDDIDCNNKDTINKLTDDINLTILNNT